MSQIEMVSSLCGHCANYHFNKQRQPENKQECHDLALNIQRSMWLTITTARRKLSKIREQINNETRRNDIQSSNENTMKLQQTAYKNHKIIDQTLQCFNNSLGKSEPEHSCCVPIRNGASVVLMESSKMNGLVNNDVSTSYSNGALDGHTQCIRSLEMQVTSPIEATAKTTMTTVTPAATATVEATTMTTATAKRLQSISISPSTLRCAQCRCTNFTHQILASASESSGQSNSFSRNVHENENPRNFSEKNERLTTNCSNSKISCAEENGIDSNCSSRSVRTFSVNYKNNHPRKHAYVNHRWPYAISSTMNYSHVLLICIAFIVFGLRSALVLADNTPATATQKNTTENGICSSKDIRNNVKNFNELRNCNVIEGFLMITLIDKYNDTDYDNVSFPNLTEVTEFVLFYRVNGLKSIGKLFPNLRVIRGNILIHDFSFIIFEMMHLQEIGLKSLIRIARGSVRIEKNPALCFVDTIDWSTLVASGIRENVISNNKAINECPTCPSQKPDNNNNELSKINSDLTICPESPELKRRVCWNRQQCQQICPPKCGNSTCNANGECCDDLCLGCENDNKDKCLSCRYLSFGNFTNHQCVKSCPTNTFIHDNRRCVTADECRALKRPVYVKYEFNLPELPYIPRQDGECQVTCPSDYYPDGPNGNRTCVKCIGSCKKECPPGKIDGISNAQYYRGCTHITGSLEINIRSQGSQNIVRELETFLSDIEEIEGSLSIVRSYPLLSLGFFKKLRVIKGNTEGKDRYGLRVVENQNLQALFTQNVTVEHGRLFFHFNPKLCMSFIEKVKEHVNDLKNVDTIPPDEVAPNSNGDKTACNLTELTVEITKISHNLVIMKLHPLEYEDERQLLGYLLYYMPAPYQNVTMFDGRDACGGDGWQVDDILDDNRNHTPISVLATHLKPYTQYAYYIRTYTVASEQRGGITKIQYFTTAPYKPDPVTKLSVLANGSSEIIVQWGPPIRSHGNLTHYVIKCIMVPDDIQLLEQRDYCKEPLGAVEPTIPVISSTNSIKPTIKEKDPSDSGCGCDAEDGRERTKLSDADAEQLIEFEDELHNTVYVRQENLERRRRDTSTLMQLMNTPNLNIIKTRSRRSGNISLSSPDVFPNTAPVDSKVTIDDEISRKDNETNTYYKYFYAKVNASVHTFTLKQLKHYTYYSVSVKAVRAGSGDNSSNEVIAYQRTGKIEDADDVSDVSIEKLPASNHSTGVKVSWKAPENPNGLVVSYIIRYQRVDLDHAKFQEVCIPQNLYRTQGNSHKFSDLLSGNYSFIVMANSLAGPSNRWSRAVYFVADDTFLSGGMIALIVILIILLLCGIAALVWFYKRKYGPPDSGLKLIASVNPEYVSMQYTPDEWEIPRDKIIQMKELGQGSFGMVYEGILLNADRDRERIRCAIKTVNENATDRERINFLKEAAVMKAFDTHHVVRLLGVVSRGQPVLVIMELMVNGDLKGYLRSHRPEAGNDIQPPTLRRILQMAIEIADGMAYLSAKKFVHRDLAARNCMVAEDLTVKIGDFGMTRDIYETDYYRKGTKGLLPVRWMAPESLKDGVFSSSSDVFSFGIVLWEMATLASQPYQGLSNDQVLRYVIDGGVMERPENCPEKLYTLMCRTWQHRPSARPTFLQIVSMLLDEASPNFRQVSFYHSQPGQELLQLPQHQLMEVVDVRTPLRAEEENFSVGADDEEEDPEDPNMFLMEKRNISSHPSASASGPSNSPLRSEISGNSSTIPITLSKPVPKNHSKMPSLPKASHQPSTSSSLFNVLHPSNSPTTNSVSALASRTHCNDSDKMPLNADSTAIIMPSSSLFGRNGIKTNLNQLSRLKFGDNSNTNNTGDNSNNDYCNTSGTGDAKAYKLLNSLS